MLGSFFRWRYEIRSGPGADAFGSCLRNLLIRDGVTWDMLNSVTISGLGMASSTQVAIGKEEYRGPLEFWKVDLKCTRPTSMVKEGLASCLGWQTDLAKVHGFFLKHMMLTVMPAETNTLSRILKLRLFKFLYYPAICFRYILSLSLLFPLVVPNRANRLRVTHIRVHFLSSSLFAVHIERLHGSHSVPNPLGIAIKYGLHLF